MRRSENIGGLMRRREFMIRLGGAVAAPSVLWQRGAFAQGFPAKPIKVIVPFPPGGPADTAVRIAQPGMEKALGQSLIVENVPGAAGGIGAQRVKQSEPDGYTLLQAASPHTTNAAVKPQGNVDLLRDFAPTARPATAFTRSAAATSSGPRPWPNWWHSPKPSPANSRSAASASAPRIT
jgi:tripartite-type tricarboxylate transporter receptor subunit TctC